MNLQTKYNVGHIFWAPRCYKRFEKEKIVWDGEEWYRDVPRYEAVAKQKEIIAIDIKVNPDNTVFIQYGCLDLGSDKDNLSQWYGENRITEYTEEQALEIAKHYAEKQEEYYGN